MQIYTNKGLTKQYKAIDFKVEFQVNNRPEKILINAGAKISICGIEEAKKRELSQKMCPTKHKRKPCNIQTIPLLAIAPNVVTHNIKRKVLKEVSA